jgi:hypothetical protein
VVVIPTATSQDNTKSDDRSLLAGLMGHASARGGLTGPTKRDTMNIRVVFVITVIIEMRQAAGEGRRHIT